MITMQSVQRSFKLKTVSFRCRGTQHIDHTCLQFPGVVQHDLIKQLCTLDEQGVNNWKSSYFNRLNQEQLKVWHMDPEAVEGPGTAGGS